MERMSIAATILLFGCASTTAPHDPDAAGAVVDAANGKSIDAAGTEGACDSGSFATAVASDGTLTCGTLDEATAVAVRARCSLYLGQHDSCDGCTDPPTKWSASSPLACSPGVGAGNACVSATLDDPTTPVTLATLDLDGDVNDDDKIYTGLHCIAAPRPMQPAPCAAGWAVAGLQGDTWMCAPISEAAIAYVGTKCAPYLGWTDSCNGCTSPPTKWGFANDAGCTNGTGANDTCTTATLGGETVNLFGLNTDGDVNDDDKFDLGLSCDATTTPSSAATGLCPTGEFVTATNTDGSFECSDPTAAFAAYVDAHCTLFFGWHDSCDACTDVPTKWGQVSTGGCSNGAGADDTCTTMTLGPTSVQMFGLNTDGNVNADDTFYIGFRCDP